VHVESEEGPLEFIFVDEITKKKFILWSQGMIEGEFEELFEKEPGDEDLEYIIAEKGREIEEEDMEAEVEPPDDVIEDTGKDQKSYGLPDDEEDPWEVKELELTMEPLGLTIKAAKQYRETAGGIFKKRMLGAVSAFKRNLRKLLGAPTANLQDQEQIKLLVKVAIDRFLDTIGTTAERAFQLLVEEGMSSAGVNMLKQQLSPENVRALFYDSPLWETYSNMSVDLVRETNDVITNHLIRTTDIDKYGKPHGLDREAMIDDLVDVAGLQENRARTIARTESRIVRNKGKEIGFKIKDPEGLFLYKWGGPYDRPSGYYDRDPSYRNAPSCRWVADQIPPQGVTMEKLKALVREATVMFHPGLKPRDLSCHPNCMHTPQKVPQRFRVTEEMLQSSWEHMPQEDGSEGVDAHA